MIFHEKYELLALRGGDQEIALPGREISSGRDVLVHLLAAGYTPENVEILAALDKLPAGLERCVLDKGDHEGIPYVVTEVLPETVKLREWLAAAKSEAPPPPVKSTAHRGVWKVPSVLEASPESAVPAPAQEPERVKRPPTQDDMPTAQMAVPRLDEMALAAPEPGEFTRMMRAEVAPPPAAAPALAPAAPEPGEFTRMMRAEAAPPPVAAPAPPPAAPELGEFTRMMRAEAAPPPPMLPAVPPVAAPAPPPAEPEQGEFTRILRAAAPPPPPAPPAVAAAAAQAPPPAAPEPGEFTQMFQAQTPPAPAVSGVRQGPMPPPAPAQPQPTAPGEFTRMMQSPLAPEPLRARPTAASPPSVSQFDRMIQAGQLEQAPPREVQLPGSGAPPPRQARPMQASDEFDRLFESEPEPSEGLAASSPPPAPLPQGGAATGVFSRPSVPAAPQAPSGPSEFTQMFAARPPALPAKTPAPAPAAAPPAQAEKKSYLPLILILGGTLLLVVIVILVFLLMR